jgi:hypothetical protein
MGPKSIQKERIRRESLMRPRNLGMTIEKKTEEKARMKLYSN